MADASSRHPAAHRTRPARLPVHEHPIEIRLVEGLPRNATGKVQRKSLP
ncbi:hypothetical protein [Nocardiopsis composta]|uniref:Acyl-coenzyme A synthetase/AMP-(Fatty) acid ligase n=1 Tax=Nocardiopsis composta TaxID=157465 RepID=A0A7W8VBL9_9ACTN|nr:acyl-coenzyme A synthetase/AMP-(fatty) acid ligase [Nocardiopsis composta]